MQPDSATRPSALKPSWLVLKMLLQVWEGALGSWEALHVTALAALAVVPLLPDFSTSSLPQAPPAAQQNSTLHKNACEGVVWC
jgi:hypothetical protein